MLDHIKETLEMMRESELAELELQRDNLKLRLRKQDRTTAAAVPAPAAPASPHRAVAPVSRIPIKSEDTDVQLVKSPVVGTFRRTQNPGGVPPTDVGQAVKRGQVLAIVEAIRLSHEIKAACNGSIVSVSARDGQAVQYGEHLFEIAPE